MMTLQNHRPLHRKAAQNNLKIIGKFFLKAPSKFVHNAVVKQTEWDDECLEEIH